jgi:hypothetical protein
MQALSRPRKVEAYRYTGDLDELRNWVSRFSETIAIAYKRDRNAFTLLDGRFIWYDPGTWLVWDEKLEVLSPEQFYTRYEVCDPCQIMMNSINSLL